MVPIYDPNKLGLLEVFNSTSIKDNNVVFYKKLDNLSFVTLSNANEVSNYTNKNSKTVLFYLYKEDDNASHSFIRMHGGDINNFSNEVDVVTAFDENDYRSWGEILGNTSEKEALVREANYHEVFKIMQRYGDSFGLDNSSYPWVVLYDNDTKKIGKVSFNGYDSKKIFSEMINIITQVKINNGIDFLEDVRSENQIIALVTESFRDLYDKYTKKVHGSIIKIANTLNINRATLRKRIDGKKFGDLFRRDEIIAMAICFDLNLEKTNEFLLSYMWCQLNMYNKRDQIIIEGINHHKTVDQINWDLYLYFNNDREMLNLRPRRNRE